MKPFKNALLHPFDKVLYHSMMHMQVGYGWLPVEQPVQKVSPKSKPSTWENPFATSLALFLTITPWSSCLFLNTHFVPMILASCGGFSRVQTSLRVKLLSSSCMAFTQSGSCSASSIQVGSTQETKEWCSIKLACLCDRVITPCEGLPMIRSYGCACSSDEFLLSTTCEEDLGA